MLLPSKHGLCMNVVGIEYLKLVHFCFRKTPPYATTAYAISDPGARYGCFED